MRRPPFTARPLALAVALTVAAPIALALDTPLTTSTSSTITESLNVVQGAGTVTTNNDNNVTQVTGKVSGTGELVKQGEGTLLLTADNAYTGGTSIQQGTLSISQGTGVGTGDVKIANNAILQANQSFTLNNNVVLQNNAADLTQAVVDTNGNNNILNGVISGQLQEVVTGTVEEVARKEVVVDGVKTGTFYNVGKVRDVNGVLSADVFINGSQAQVGQQATGYTGGALLVKEGGGRLVLSNTNNSQIGTVVNGGILAVSDEKALGAGNTVVIQQGTLQTLQNMTITKNIRTETAAGGSINTAGSDVTHAGEFNGGGSLIKSGAGTLTLTNNVNNYNGTKILGGTLSVSVDTSLGVQAQNVSDATADALATRKTSNIVNSQLVLDGGVLSASSNMDNKRAIKLGLAGGSVEVDSKKTLTLEGLVSGGGTSGLVKQGEGTLYLSLEQYQAVKEDGSTTDGGAVTAQTFTGNTTIKEGVLVVDNVAKDLGASKVVLAGGELRTLLSSELSGLTLESTGGAIDTTGTTTSITGDIKGSGDLRKKGSGTLILTKDNSEYTGKTIISEGKLQITSSGALGANGSLVLDGGVLQSAASLTLQNSAVQITSSNGTIDSAKEITIGGKVSGDGQLIKSGAGTLKLTADNTFKSGVKIKEGTLEVKNDNSLGEKGGEVVIDGATLGITGGENTVLTRDIKLTENGGTISVSNATATLEGKLLFADGTTSADFTKAGAGNLNLTQDNTQGSGFKGNTIIQGGTLGISSQNNLAQGQLFLDGGNLRTNAAIADFQKEIIINSTGGIDTNGFDSKVSSVIQGDGAFIKNGLGTLEVTADNSYAGGTEVKGGVLLVEKDSNLGSAKTTVTLDGGAVKLATGSTVDFSKATGRSIVIGDNGGTLDINNQDVTIGTAITGNGSFVKKGTGTLTLDGKNTALTGDVSSKKGVVVEEGALAITTDDNLGSTEAILALKNNTTLKTAAAITLNRDVELTSGKVTLEQSQDLTFSRQVTGAADLVKKGGNTLSFDGDNSTYTGNILVESGTVAVQQNLGSGAIKFQDENTLTTLQTKGNVTLQNQLVLSGETAINTQQNTKAILTKSIDAATGKTATLKKQGAGELQLNAASTYAGGTVVENGIVTVANNLALGTGTVQLDNDTTLQSAADVALSNNVNLGGSTGTDTGEWVSLSTPTATSLTLNGQLSGDAGIVKKGLSTLTLNGQNTYQGATAINEGKVVIKSAGALGSNSAVTLQAGASLETSQAIAQLDKNIQLNTTATATEAIINTANGKVVLTGQLSGAAGLVKRGASELELSNTSNNYQGKTIIEAGALSISNAQNLGNKIAVELAGGDLKLLQSINIGTGDSIKVTGTKGAIDTASGTTSTLGVALGGTGQFIKKGDGSLVLSGQNDNFEGGISVDAGTLSVAANNNLGKENTTLTLNGGTLATTGSMRLVRDVVLNADSTIKNSSILSVNRLMGDHQITVDGGFVDLAADATHTNTHLGTVLKNTTATIKNDADLGKAAGQLSLAGNSTLQAQGQINSTRKVNVNGVSNILDTNAHTVTLGELNGAGELKKSGDGDLVLANSSANYSGPFELVSGQVVVGHSQALGVGSIVFNDATGLKTSVSVNLANETTLNGQLNVHSQGFNSGLFGKISGSGSIIKDGIGQLRLNNDNSYAGGTVVNEGKVAIDANGALGTGKATFANNTDLSLGMTKGVSVANSIQLDGQVKVHSSTFDSSLANVMGSGSIIKDGIGQLRLNNDNSYAGGTVVNEGKVAIDANGALGTGKATFANNTDLSLGMTKGVSVANSIQLDGQVKVHSSTFDSSLANVMGSGSIIKDGIGQLRLNNDNSYAGGTVVNEGKVAIDANGALGTGKATFANNTDLSLGMTKGVSVANSIQLDGQVKVHSSTFDSSLANVMGSGSIIKDGIGQLRLNNDNSYAGGTVVNEGKVAIDANGALGTGKATFANNTDLSLGMTKGVSVANSIQLDGQVKVHSSTFDSSLANVMGSGSIIKDGIGQLRLNNDNSYAGGTVVNEGKVAIDANGALGTGKATFANNTDLSLGMTKGVSVANSIQLDGQVKVHSSTFDSSLANVMGSGSIIKDGIGQLRLNNDNSYAGGTVVNEGKVAIDANGALGTGKATFANNTDLSLGMTKGVSVANSIQLDGQVKVHSSTFDSSLANVMGSGSIIKDGIGQLRLNNDNSYAGGTVVNEGKVAIDANGALGTGKATFANNTDLSLGMTKGVSVANSIQLDGQVKVHSSTFDSSLANVMGSGSIIKDGIGQLRLNNDNSYAGGTVVNEGKVAIDANGALGTGKATFANNTDLSLGMTKGVSVANSIQLDGQVKVHSSTFDSSLANVMGSGSIIKDGIGQLRLNNDNSYAGGTVVNEGKVAIDANGALGTGKATFANNTDLSLGMTKGVSVANSIQLDGQVKVHSSTFDSSLANVMGSGSIIKDGIGQLRLNNDNSYAGGTVVNEGKVAIDANGALGTGKATFANNTDLSLGMTKGVSVANSIQLDGQVKVHSSTFDSSLANVMGSGSIIKDGIGQLRLNNDNSYAGGTVVNEGKVVIGANQALGLGKLELLAGAVLENSKTVVLHNQIALTGTSKTISMNTLDATSMTLAQNISGNGNLAKDGAGTLVLQGVNSTYQGNIVVNQGKIIANNNDALGVGVLTLETAKSSDLVIELGRSVSQLNNQFVLNGDGNDVTKTDRFELNIAQNQATNLLGKISGDAGILKTGLGTLTLSGANTYQGDTNIDKGKLIVNSSSALGQATGTLILQGGTELELSTNVPFLENNIKLQGSTTVQALRNTLLSGVISGSGSMSKQGDGTLTLNRNNTYTGQTLIYSGKVAIQENQSLGVNNSVVFKTDGTQLHALSTVNTLANDLVVEKNALLQVDGVTSMSGNLSGAGALTKLGAGTLILTHNNKDYAGSITVDTGKLSIATSESLGTSAVLNLKAASTLEITSDLVLSKELNLMGDSNPATTGDVVDLFVSDAKTAQFTQKVKGDAGFVKKGTGTLVLSNDNSYTGGTIVNEGKVAIDANAALGTGKATFANNTDLSLGMTKGVSVANSIQLDGQVKVHSSTFDSSLASVMGSGSIVKDGMGQLSLNNDNTYTGGTIVNEGKISLGANQALGTGNVVFQTNTALVLSKSLNIANNVQVLGATQLQNTVDSTLSGVLSGIGALTKVGTGTLSLTQDNSSYTGAMNIQEGGVIATANNALGSAALTLMHGTSLATQGAIELANSRVVLDGDKDTNTVTDNVTINIDNMLSLKGVVEGDANLIKSGLGVLSLENANTAYTGNILVSSGGVSITNASALGSGEVSFADGTKLLSTATTASVKNKLQLLGQVVIDTNNSLSLDGLGVTGVGGLIKQGAGTLTLKSDNSYTGNTILEQGTVIAASSTAFATGSVTTKQGTVLDLQQSLANVLQIDGATTLTTNTTQTLSGLVTGTGSLVKDGTGTVVFSANNANYQGDILVKAGTLAAQSNTALGTNTVSLSQDTVLQANQSIDLANNIQLLGNASVNTTANNAALLGSLSGTGALTKTGTGILTLSGNNAAYQANINVNSGTLAASSDANLGDVTQQKLVLNNGVFKSLTDQSYSHNVMLSGTAGTIDTNGRTVTWTGVIAGDKATQTTLASSLTKVGAGTLILAADNTYEGKTSINAGTLVVNKAANLGLTANVDIGTATLQTLTDIELKNVSLNGSSTLLSNNTINVSGVISGAGALIKQGTGQLVLAGVNTYSGGTTLDAGTLVLSNGSSLGLGGLTVKSGQVKLQDGFVSIQTLRQNSLNTNTVITGNGKFANTIVEEGLLLIDGVLTSPITVGSKGVLGGSGTIVGNLDVFGVLSPGKSPATMIVQGNATQHTGSTLAIDIDGATSVTSPTDVKGHYDQVNVTGTYTIQDGATLIAKLRGITGEANNTFVPSIGQSFEVVKANSINGIFAKYQQLEGVKDGLSADSILRVGYTPNSVLLYVTPKSYSSIANSSNTQGTGLFLDQILKVVDQDPSLLAGSTDVAKFYRALIPANSQALNATLLSMSPAIYAETAQSVLALQQTLHNTQTLSDVFKKGGIALKALSQEADIDSDGNGLAATRTMTGVQLSLDSEPYDNNWQMGAALSLVNKADVESQHANITAKGQDISVSIRKKVNNWMLSAAFDMGSYEFDTKRNVVVGTNVFATHQEGVTATTQGLAFNASYDMGSWLINSGMRYNSVQQDGFTEAGNSLLKLTVAGVDEDQVVAMLGGTWSQTWKKSMWDITPKFGLQLEQILVGDTAQLNAKLGSQMVNASASDAGKTLLRATVGINFVNADGLSVGLDASVEEADGLSSQTGRLLFSKSF